MDAKETKHFILNTDCMELMKRYEDNYFDLAIVDPPYGINAPNMQMGTRKNHDSTSTKLKKNRLTQGSGKLKNRILNKSIINWDDEAPSKEYFDELFRVSKNQIIFGGNYFNLPPTRCVIVWDKVQPWTNFSQVEIAWTSFDFPAKLYKVSTRGGNNKETKIHPTQKPVKLYDLIYRDFVKPEFKILDTHLGSASHRITAHKLKIDEFVASEIDRNYFLDAEKRFLTFSNQRELQF